MALNGLPPDPNHVRRHKDAYTPSKFLVDDGEIRGPELDPEDRSWHKKTLDWWDRWRRSPLAQLFTPSDWDTLERAALLYEELWFDENLRPVERTARTKEIDRITANLGGTYTDRLKMRVAIVDEVPREPGMAVPVSKVNYRASLGADG